MTVAKISVSLILDTCKSSSIQLEFNRGGEGEKNSSSLGFSITTFQRGNFFPCYHPDFEQNL